MPQYYEPEFKQQIVYHATYLLLNGINVKEVSKRLGHSSISTTLELYAHWIPEMDESAANTIGKGFIF